MTTMIYDELSSKMKKSIGDAVSRNAHTVVFDSSPKLDGEAQSILGVPGSPFVGAVYEPNQDLRYSPGCYILSDEIVAHLSR